MSLQALTPPIFSQFYINIFTSVLVTVIILYYFSTSTYGFWKNAGVNFVKPVPFFGNTLDVAFRFKSNQEVLQEIYNKASEERYIGMFNFRTPFLMLREPQLIHTVLTKDFSSFYDRGVPNDERLDLLSLHLVNLKGQSWKSLRSKLTTTFSPQKLKGMCPLIEECTTVLTDYLEHIVTQADSSVDFREIMAKFATDVIGSCAFGVQFNALKDPNSQFRKMGQQIFERSLRSILKFAAEEIHPGLPYYLNLKALNSHVEKFFLDFVKDSVKQREENNFERKDFIQLLIEVRRNELTQPDSEEEKSYLLTDQVIASNAFVFFFAGFETTSSTMSFMLLELAANPDIQDRLRQEIVQAMEKNNWELTYEAVKDLPYLEMVISETLRKYPIGSLIVRTCTQSYEIPGSSSIIKKGTRLVIPVFSIHRDPKYYPQPEKFDPERFSIENKGKIVPGSYLPFGDGPRICIGLRFAMLEMKFVTCKILPKHRFALSKRMAYPMELKLGSSLLAPKGGIWLDVSKV